MELLKSLNIDLIALPVNIVGFLALLFIAQKLVFLPIGKVISERQADVDKTYDGPKLPVVEGGKYGINHEFVTAMIQWFKDGKAIPRRYEI